MSSEDVQRLLGQLMAKTESLEKDIRLLRQEVERHRSSNAWLLRTAGAAGIAIVVKFALSGGFNVAF